MIQKGEIYTPTYEADAPELSTTEAEKVIIAGLLYEARGHQWTLTIPHGKRSIDVISAALGSKTGP